MRDIVDRLHWPQVVLLAMTIASLTLGPVAFFTLVPERTIEKILNLPWTAISTVLATVLIPAIASLVSPWLRPVVAKTEPDSKAGGGS